MSEKQKLPLIPGFTVYVRHIKFVFRTIFRKNLDFLTFFLFRNQKKTTIYLSVGCVSMGLIFLLKKSIPIPIGSLTMEKWVENFHQNQKKLWFWLMCMTLFSIDPLFQSIFSTKFDRMRCIPNSQSENLILHGRWNGSSKRMSTFFGFKL